MQLRFSKMHGLGNDFMVVDLVSQHVTLAAEAIRAWADRHTGVGFDQLLALEPPQCPNHDFFYRIYNADGSEVEQCGNGARCLASFVHDHGLSVKQHLTLETRSGSIVTTRLPDGHVEVDMGIPSTEPGDVPFLADAEQLTYSVATHAGHVPVTPVSIGNPHAVVFVDDVTAAPVDTLGPLLMCHERFPEGANVGFAEVVDPAFVRLRVYERGVGETLACGSGACASVVAGRLKGLLEERVKVSLSGGKVRISWQGRGSAVKLVGTACLVYEGSMQIPS